MCVVITTVEGKRRIDYNNSLKANQTRSQGVHKYKLQISILQVVLSYLQAKHVELNKDKAWSNDWITNPSCSAPQQENRIDCGVFVCMYIGFIHDGCKLDFTQKDIDSGVGKGR
jgi:Ulp1 family protease